MPLPLRCLIVAAAVVDGLLAGASLDQSIKQLPARRRIGARPDSAYSQAADLGNGVALYAGLGIGGTALTIAAARVALTGSRSSAERVPLKHRGSARDCPHARDDARGADQLQPAQGRR